MELKFEKEGPSSNKAIRKKINLSMMIVGFLREARKDLSEKDMKDLINAHVIMLSTFASAMSALGYESLETMMKGVEMSSKETLKEMDKNETV